MIKLNYEVVITYGLQSDKASSKLSITFGPLLIILTDHGDLEKCPRNTAKKTSLLFIRRLRI